MAGWTISEKILSAKAGGDARAGEVVFCRVDCAMGTDGSVPMALDYFGDERRHSCSRRSGSSSRWIIMRRRRARHGAIACPEARVCDGAGNPHVGVGEGIGHQLVVEQGLGTPGSLVPGADSHAVTWGDEQLRHGRRVQRSGGGGASGNYARDRRGGRPGRVYSEACKVDRDYE